MKLKLLAATLFAMIAPAVAHAGTVATFNGVCASTASATQAACSSGLTGAYGNSATIYATNDATLGVKITAWQATQTQDARLATGSFAMNNAFLGAYGGGFGVTGNGDSNGSGNLHQIDNTGGYTDFVLLQFSTAVHLEGVNVNYYGINSVYDSDASFFNANGVTNSSGSAMTAANWDSSINLASGYYFQPSLSGWSNTVSTPDNATAQGSAYRANTATGFSQVWLVSASVVATDRDDGFKLASLSVTRQTPAVPEPATWAMMILGFGFVGASLRRRAEAKPALA